MHLWLEIALLFASIAIVALVGILVPTLLFLRGQSERLIKITEELKTDVEDLMKDTRDVLHNVKALSQRAHQQMDEVQRVVHTVRDWSQRANRVVQEVGSAIEPPILTAARTISIFRTGLVGFVRALFHQNDKTKKKEE